MCHKKAQCEGIPYIISKCHTDSDWPTVKVLPVIVRLFSNVATCTNNIFKKYANLWDLIGMVIIKIHCFTIRIAILHKITFILSTPIVEFLKNCFLLWVTQLATLARFVSENSTIVSLPCSNFYIFNINFLY